MTYDNQGSLKLFPARKSIVFLTYFTSTVVIALLVFASKPSWSYLSHLNASTVLTPTPLASLGLGSSTGLTNEEKTEIEGFLQHSNTVHDIVQEEVADSLNRFMGLLGLFGALVVVAGTYWAKQTMKNQR